ncbi:MAG: CoA transferase [Burkholderiales bacterium]|nr:CoA transferase [Burkholderiales bacterium]
MAIGTKECFRLDVGRKSLSGCRVVEIGSGSALAYAGKLLAAFGAEVVKVEAPGGDPGRAEPPLVDCGDGALESAYFAWLNAGKSSPRLDQAALRRLVLDADILLDGRAPGAGATGELAHGALRSERPDIVIIAISWFGEHGPYRDYLTTDASCRALAGLIHLIGPLERPVGINDHQADIVGGLWAYIAALSGLMARGRRFELSIHEAVMTLSETHTAYGPNGPRARLGNNRFANTYPIGVFRCSAGWLGIGVSSFAQWRGFCELFDMIDAADDPRYAVGADRSARWQEIEPRFVPKLKERTAAQWFAESLKRKLPFAIVPEMHELLAQPVFRDAGAIAQVCVGAASFEGPAVPLRLPLSPPPASGIAPMAHASESPAPRPERVAGRLAHAAAKRPLEGTRIVDLTMGWAGPLATRTLADLGAEVVKVEACAHADWWRGQDPRPAYFEQKLYEQRPNYLCMNRNKLGITLDLTTADGIGLAKRLVARADAVIENYAHGVAGKLGLGYAALSATKPDLVMVSMPAFRTGPWAAARAYGFTLEQASGLPTIAGNPDGPPLLTHYAYGDPIGGLNATCALLTALWHRRRTGEGQHIEISQVECMLPLTAPWMIEQSVLGRIGERNGNRHPRHVPQNCFRCAGEDSFIHIGIGDDAMWQRLCRAIGREDLAADAALADAPGRRAHEASIEAAIEAWTLQHDADDAMRALQAEGVAAGVVRSPYDLAADPHLATRGFWQPVERAFCGSHLQSSLPFREAARPYPVRSPAPTLGEHNQAVLGDLLGVPAAELERLAKLGVIGTEALPPARKSKRA